MIENAMIFDFLCDAVQIYRYIDVYDEIYEDVFNRKMCNNFTYFIKMSLIWQTLTTVKMSYGS